MAINWPYKKPPSVKTQNNTEIYTPPNWSNKSPQLYCIRYRTKLDTMLSAITPILNSQVVPGGEITNLDLPPAPTFVSNNQGRSGYNATTGETMLVFDAIKRAQHSQSAITTQHPVQAGFSIADHIVKQPMRLVLEVAMSDAIASYALTGYTPMWSINPSKSVAAYQQMVLLMDNRQVVTIMTRLDEYDTMVLTNIEVEDSERTYFGGLAMVMTFQQIFVADISVSYESARIQASDETKQGTVQPQPPTKTVIDQHKVPNILEKSAQDPLQGTFIPGIPFDINTFGKVTVPGAGLWTSNPSQSDWANTLRAPRR